MHNEPKDLIGPKARVCLALILIYPSLLTGIILKLTVNVKLEFAVLIITMLMAYVTALIISDYTWLRTTPDIKKRRTDIYLLKDLLHLNIKD